MIFSCIGMYSVIITFVLLDFIGKMFHYFWLQQSQYFSYFSVHFFKQMFIFINIKLNKVKADVTMSVGRQILEVKTTILGRKKTDKNHSNLECRLYCKSQYDVQ